MKDVQALTGNYFFFALFGGSLWHSLIRIWILKIVERREDVHTVIATPIPILYPLPSSCAYLWTNPAVEVT